MGKKEKPKMTLKEKWNKLIEKLPGGKDKSAEQQEMAKVFEKAAKDLKSLDANIDAIREAGLAMLPEEGATFAGLTDTKKYQDQIKDETASKYEKIRDEINDGVGEIIAKAKGDSAACAKALSATLSEIAETLNEIAKEKLQNGVDASDILVGLWKRPKKEVGNLGNAVKKIGKKKATFGGDALAHLNNITEILDRQVGDLRDIFEDINSGVASLSSVVSAKGKKNSEGKFAEESLKQVAGNPKMLAKARKGLTPTGAAKDLDAVIKNDADRAKSLVQVLSDVMYTVKNLSDETRKGIDFIYRGRFNNYIAKFNELLSTDHAIALRTEKEMAKGNSAPEAIAEQLSVLYNKRNKLAKDVQKLGKKVKDTDKLKGLKNVKIILKLSEKTNTAMECLKTGKSQEPANDKNDNSANQAEKVEESHLEEVQHEKDEKPALNPREIKVNAKIAEMSKKLANESTTQEDVEEIIEQLKKMAVMYPAAKQLLEEVRVPSKKSQDYFADILLYSEINKQNEGEQQKAFERIKYMAQRGNVFAKGLLKKLGFTVSDTWDKFRKNKVDTDVLCKKIKDDKDGDSLNFEKNVSNFKKLANRFGYAGFRYDQIAEGSKGGKVEFANLDDLDEKFDPSGEKKKITPQTKNRNVAGSQTDQDITLAFYYDRADLDEMNRTFEENQKKREQDELVRQQVKKEKDKKFSKGLKDILYKNKQRPQNDEEAVSILTSSSSYSNNATKNKKKRPNRQIIKKFSGDSDYNSDSTDNDDESMLNSSQKLQNMRKSESDFEISKLSSKTSNQSDRYSFSSDLSINSTTLSKSKQSPPKATRITWEELQDMGAWQHLAKNQQNADLMEVLAAAFGYTMEGEKSSLTPDAVNRALEKHLIEVGGRTSILGENTNWVLALLSKTPNFADYKDFCNTLEDINTMVDNQLLSVVPDHTEFIRFLADSGKEIVKVRNVCNVLKWLYSNKLMPELNAAALKRVMEILYSKTNINWLPNADLACDAIIRLLADSNKDGQKVDAVYDDLRTLCVNNKMPDWSKVNAMELLNILYDYNDGTASERQKFWDFYNESASDSKTKDMVTCLLEKRQTRFAKAKGDWKHWKNRVGKMKAYDD